MDWSRARLAQVVCGVCVMGEKIHQVIQLEKFTYEMIRYERVIKYFPVVVVVVIVIVVDVGDESIASL